MDANSTTFRHYSLFAGANQAVERAQDARHAAYLAAQVNPTKENFDKFLAADKAYEQAKADLDQVRGLRKHMHGTVLQ